MEAIKTFEDLECWKKGTALRRGIFKVIKMLPDSEKFELASQLRRASRSVTHNIAEGHGRFHYKENAQFCRTSRGSAYELSDQILVAYDEHYIDEEKYNELRSMIMNCLHVLNEYINISSKLTKPIPIDL